MNSFFQKIWVVQLWCLVSIVYLSICYYVENNRFNIPIFEQYQNIMPWMSEKERLWNLNSTRYWAMNYSAFSVLRFILGQDDFVTTNNWPLRNSLYVTVFLQLRDQTLLVNEVARDCYHRDLPKAKWSWRTDGGLIRRMVGIGYFLKQTLFYKTLKEKEPYWGLLSWTSHRETGFEISIAYAETGFANVCRLDRTNFYLRIENHLRKNVLDHFTSLKKWKKK